MNIKIKSLGLVISIALILCIALPILWLYAYIWQHCLWPPSGPNVEVIVSACEAPRLYSISPDGKYLLYTANRHGKYQSLLQDTTVGEERPAFAMGRFWLSDTLFVNGFVPQIMVADVSDESLIPLQWVQNIPEATFRNENDTLAFSPEVRNWFRSAEKVYFISWYRWVIALGPDFKNHPEGNYILATPNTARAGDEETIMKFLKDNQIAYTEVGYPNNGSDLISHNGRFVMPSRGTGGFYTVEGTKIGPFYDFIRDRKCCLAYGWAYDDSGIYVQGSTEGSSSTVPSPGQVQPILKLNLPPEYLSPEALQIQRAHQTQALMGMILRVSALVLPLMAGLWFFWRRKRKNAPPIR